MIFNIKTFACFSFIFVSGISCTASQVTVQNPASSQQFASKEWVADTEILSNQVVIRRTEYGVPHIKAENMRAAGYAMGYVQLEDYGEEVVEEWPRYNEPDAGEFDDAIDRAAANRRDYVRAVETYHWLKPDTRDILEGFALGVNYYIKQHPEEFNEMKRVAFTEEAIKKQLIRKYRPGQEEYLKEVVTN